MLDRAGQQFEKRFIECLATGVPPADVPGLVHRVGGVSVTTGPGIPLARLDDLPVPDFSDYFRDLAASGAQADVVPVLLFETARGCWWGAKSHCTFCGINGGAMAFRAKSQARALDELQTLSAAWAGVTPKSAASVGSSGWVAQMLAKVATPARNRASATRRSPGEPGRCPPSCTTRGA